MQRKICPICDHVMKSSHYCHFCKRWVSNPNSINATYYLNECHPAHETDCEYHAPSFRTAASSRDGSKSGKQRRVQPGSGAEKSRRQKNPVATVVGVVVMLFFLMTFMGSFLPLLFFFF